MERIITETKRVNINKDCLINPICLKWLNPYGGWDIWVFNKNYEKSINVNSSEMYRKFITDLSNTAGNQDIIGRRAFKSYKLGAENINKDKYLIGLESLLYTPKCLMLTNNDTWQTEGAKWQTVIVKDSDIVTDMSNETMINIELEILLPELNIQSL